jgi:hypothetical protein
MAALYGGEVFDEWAVIALSTTGAALPAYEGPRAEQFRARFLTDIQTLRSLLTGRGLALGEFAFAPTAQGTAIDACVRIGENAYLLFNHTVRSMEEIRSDARWLQAQRAFVELTEAFQADPVI